MNIRQLHDSFKFSLEKNAFGVCSYIGERIGIPPGRIRLYFIYSSFFALGSPVIIYLVTAFWLSLKNYVRTRRNTLWDL